MILDTRLVIVMSPETSADHVLHRSDVIILSQLIVLS